MYDGPPLRQLLLVVQLDCLATLIYRPHSSRPALTDAWPPAIGQHTVSLESAAQVHCGHTPSKCILSLKQVRKECILYTGQRWTRRLIQLWRNPHRRPEGHYITPIRRFEDAVTLNLTRSFHLRSHDYLVHPTSRLDAMALRHFAPPPYEIQGLPRSVSYPLSEFDISSRSQWGCTGPSTMSMPSP